MGEMYGKSSAYIERRKVFEKQNPVRIFAQGFAVFIKVLNLSAAR